MFYSTHAGRDPRRPPNFVSLVAPHASNYTVSWPTSHCHVYIDYRVNNWLYKTINSRFQPESSGRDFHKKYIRYHHKRNWVSQRKYEIIFVSKSKTFKSVGRYKADWDEYESVNNEVSDVTRRQRGGGGGPVSRNSPLCARAAEYRSRPRRRLPDVQTSLPIHIARYLPLPALEALLYKVMSVFSALSITLPHS